MKYTISTYDTSHIYGVDLKITENQKITIIENTGATFFKSEFSDINYFVEATDEQVKKLEELDIIEYIDEYDEAYFEINMIISNISFDLDNLISINDAIDVDRDKYLEKITEIEEILNHLKTLR